MDDHTLSPPDSHVVTRWHSRWRPSPWLHEEIAQRMAAQLAWFKYSPAVWGDVNPAQGGLEGHQRVASHFPNAQVYWTAPHPSVQAAVAQHLFPFSELTHRHWPWSWLGSWLGHRLPGQKRRLLRSSRSSATPCVNFPPESLDMLWANMALHQSPDLSDTLHTWHQALKPGGFVLFSGLLEDTLAPLRALYTSCGWPPPCHDFLAVDSVVQTLKAEGFVDTVIDTECLTLTFSSPATLLAELRSWGRNAHPARWGQLRGRGFQSALLRLLEQWPREKTEDRHSRLCLDIHVLYGHAWRPGASSRPASRPPQTEHRIDLESLRASLRK
jgi:malonyl-CoA O-methyltransferase